MCDNQDVTLMCHTDQTTGNIITWYWYNQSQDGDSITVMATMTGVVYNCVAYVQGREVGKSSITVRANGELDNQVYPNKLLCQLFVFQSDCFNASKSHAFSVIKLYMPVQVCSLLLLMQCNKHSY